MTVSEYLLSCKMASLSILEMKQISIGMCLDHIEEYTALKYPKEALPKQATQDDIQRLKGR